MLYALIANDKIEATPNAKAICLLCGEPVFSKCGEINIWHWAHYKNKSCDNWYEPETKWHKNWKLAFGKNNCEIVIVKNGVRHIADIRTNKEIIIELQNSPIQKPIIRKREDFYGELMFWIINGNDFKNNFLIKKHQSPIDYDEEYARRYNPLHANFGKVSNNEPNNQLYFSWSWPRQSWSGVKRSVFIDFGDEYLFLVKSGMGTKSGTGIKVSKKDFLNKYEGDITLLPTLIEH